MDLRGIDGFVAAVAHVREAELHSLMVLRHGQVVAEAWWEPYRPEAPHLLYSLSKSFTSTALGLAVAEGLVDLDATVLSYFPELDTRITDVRSRSMLVRHVASMSSGHDTDTVLPALDVGDGDLLLGLLLIPPDHEPGTVFAYNQPCTYALSAIITRASGTPLIDFLKPRLFEPLGISTYGWTTDHLGRQIGFSGLHAPTEAVASLGQLYLDRGRWQGHPLLSPEWVTEATREHVSTEREVNPDWHQGYGFQFWRSRHGYRGDGAYGQYMLVLPKADAVVAITSQSLNMQGVLDALWTHLLPALTAQGQVPAGPWTPGPLALAGPDGQTHPTSGLLPTSGPASIRGSGFAPRGASDATWLRWVEVRDDHLVLTDDGSELTVALGVPGSWTATGPVFTDHRWDGESLQVDLVFAETPHRLILRLDPSSSRFTAGWQAEPLRHLSLAQLRMPRHA